MVISSYRGFAATLFAVGVLAGPVSAQTTQGAIVSGAISAVAVDSNTSLAIAASAGYRFNRAMGLTIELTYVPSLESEPDFGAAFNAFPINSRLGNRDGRLTAFTTNIRLEMPTTSHRVLPYAVLGGGLANIRQNFDVIYDLRLGSTLIGFPIPPDPIIQNVANASTDLALALGGGVSLLLGDHLSADIDLRYLRLLGYADRNVGRFGAGVSYRF